MSVSTAFIPATDKQLAFLARLLRERNLPEYCGPDLSKRTASDLIEQVMSTPRPRPVAPAAREGEADTLTTGVYRNAGGTFRVYKARGGPHLLCQRITDDGEFEYKGGAARFVKLADRLTLEQASAYGAQIGVCCMCGALLTDPVSVAAGIGPICAGKY